MPEQVQNILNKITEWWKKFNTKQKALLISIACCTGNTGSSCEQTQYGYAA